MIWHKSFPSTVSIFIWRILHKLIPTDDNLRRRGFIFPSKCQCCYHVDNMHHVFISGPVVVKFWTYFEDIFHLNFFTTSISIYNLLDCWFVKSKGHVRNVIPSLILWFLWLERNDSHFNGVVMNYQRIIHKIKEKVAALYSANLLSVKRLKNLLFTSSTFGINLEVDYCHKVMRCITWMKPHTNSFKLNVASARLGTIVGYGGIIRDHNGIYMLGFAGPITNGYVNFSISYDMLHGLNLCANLYQIMLCWMWVLILTTILFMKRRIRFVLLLCFTFGGALGIS
ncbi:hypothetical protein KFK09_004760 [Dendrobium nobile]|uniref:Reverse transcriptase zinc-binding domain-containing protein n=1 Tax=Dendrobium nobile TaxID=94219 RepID=A0A8T3BWG3_DENNO|nr:hypothetical protein KFK09_004760 [Dendrobium nobile]